MSKLFICFDVGTMAENGFYAVTVQGNKQVTHTHVYVSHTQHLSTEG
jgi:hypothetical protein